MLNDAEIENHKKLVQDLLAQKIARLHADIPWCRSNEEAGEYRDKIQKRRQDILLFRGITGNLPPSLELFAHDIHVTAEPEALRLLDEFHDSARMPFLLHVFSQPHTQRALMRMGLSEDMIEDIQYDHSKMSRANNLRDISVDNIVPLFHGGGNADTNLCVLPYYVTKMKERFADLQTKLGLTTILGFRPKDDANGNPVPVPYIKGGFQLATKDKAILNTRMETLLKTTLKVPYESPRQNHRHAPQPRA